MKEAAENVFKCARLAVEHEELRTQRGHASAATGHQMCDAGSHLVLTAGDVALAVTFKPSVTSRCFPVNFSAVALQAACLFGGKRGEVILSVSFYNSKDASDVPSARLQTVIHYNIKRILRLTELTGKTNAGPSDEYTHDPDEGQRQEARTFSSQI